MKIVKFFALTLLTIASVASAKVNFSARVLRNDAITSGPQLTLDVDQREVCYQDENLYIEAELIEESVETILLQFTVATKNETGAFIVRGLPKLPLAVKAEEKVLSGSLQCDGPSENFTLLVTVEKLETNPIVRATE